MKTPDRINTEDELDDVMSRPSDALVQLIGKIEGPLLILGAGGKMGPSLAYRARRAADAAGRNLDILAVSRYSDPASRDWLESKNITTLPVDLMDRKAVEQLPDALNVIYLVGMKFGTAENPAPTWAFNTLIPAWVAERFAGSRIVALSSGNVYPLTDVTKGGSVETDPLTPAGEYANACVARERIFEFYSQRYGVHVVSLRLNYAVDLRYGVLVDIARKVRAGEPVDVTMGYFNCIWQGDANDLVIRALPLAETPARALNLTGSEILSVRKIAEEFGRLLDRPAVITGNEAPTALLSSPAELFRLLGPPSVSVQQVMEWTAEWMRGGGALLGKPTHFEVRDGRY